MTDLAALIGGGGGFNPVYQSGQLYLCQPLEAGPSGTPLTANQDHIVPFAPRRSVTIDALSIPRKGTDAGTIYLGVYNFAGTLLTDCAGQTDNTEGVKTVSTTPVTLTANQLYYFACNPSTSTIAASDRLEADGTRVNGWLMGFNIDAGSEGHGIREIGLFRARTNAVLPSTITLTSGWTGTNDLPNGGFVVA